MKLRDWLRANGRKSTEIVELTGKSKQLVSNWLAGARIPGPVDIARIADYTRGMVGLTDWIATDTGSKFERTSDAADAAR